MSRRQIDPRERIPERELQSAVQLIARQRGWKYYHPADNRPNQRGAVQHIVAGYPDLTMVRGKRLVYAELKAKDGTVSAAQWDWLHKLQEAGCEAYVWRPTDLISGRIAQVLA